MKKLTALSFIFLLGVSIISCKTNHVTADAEANTSEVWNEGITRITGTIMEVTQEKDGQTIKLVNNKGIEYTAVVSIPNLGENHAQYRQFKVGEEIGFKGNLVENQRMVVREVLEMK